MQVKYPYRHHEASLANRKFEEMFVVATFCFVNCWADVPLSLKILKLSYIGQENLNLPPSVCRLR